MLFNSFEFLVYLPVVFLLYWSIARWVKWQNLLVVVASYVFYGWWDWRFLSLIVFASLVSYVGGRWLDVIACARVRKMLCWAVVSLLLGLLGVLKYYNFFVESLVAGASAVGCELNWTLRYIVLPVGISFYTFQAMSYVIDVYRQDIEPEHDLVAFLAYISFFPQLVAGPIERASHLLPQFKRLRHFDQERAVDGLRQMLWGFFKKMVLADNCAIAVNMVWENHQHLSAFTLGLGAVLFAFQIYGDFSGYSDIAIGCARLFGINLTQNFCYPYFARNIQDFWRCWHISLMKWFTHYVYIPLGGSRCGRIRHVRNIVVVFVLSGLWHGANWTFVVWGLYHALLMVVVLAFGKKMASWPRALSGVLTFAAVVVGWVFFRAPTLPDAWHYLNGMIHGSLFSLGELRLPNMPVITVAIVSLLLMEWNGRHWQHPLQFTGRSFVAQHHWMREALYMSLVTAIGIWSGTQSQFIYFQF